MAVRACVTTKVADWCWKYQDMMDCGSPAWGENTATRRLGYSLLKPCSTHYGGFTGSQTIVGGRHQRRNVEITLKYSFKLYKCCWMSHGAPYCCISILVLILYIGGCKIWIFTSYIELILQRRICKCLNCLEVCIMLFLHKTFLSWIL